VLPYLPGGKWRRLLGSFHSGVLTTRICVPQDKLYYLTFMQAESGNYQYYRHGCSFPTMLYPSEDDMPTRRTITEIWGRHPAEARATTPRGNTVKKEYHLVISYDTANEELQKVILETVRKKAQEVWGAVHLAHNAMDPQSPKPDMHLYSDDFIMGKDDIEVKNPAQAVAADAIKT